MWNENIAERLYPDELSLSWNVYFKMAGREKFSGIY